MKYFGAIDQGTTSSRFIVFNESGEIVEKHQQEHRQILPDEHSVEHNANEIWESVKTCINVVDSKFNIAQLTSIGITNQRETTVAWNKKTGEPLYNAIVWQDTRTQAICDELSTIENLIQEFNKTGLPIATYFSLSKILWLIRNVPEVAKNLEVDNVCFGTIDSWLIFKITGDFFTDVTNASRTLLLNIETGKWSEKILKTLDIPLSSLPKIKPSLSNFGTNKLILKNVPITAVLGDQQASLFGNNCLSKGEIKNTYGTGCFALTNTGEDIVYSNNGLLTTIAYQLEDQPIQYAIEGSVSIAGSAVQWLRDNLNIINDSSEIESLAMQVKDNGDVYFVPAFSGLFSPHWDSTARGVLVGLTRFTNKSHIARSVLESVAYQSYDLLTSMERDTGERFEVIKVDGGMINNNLLMQFQSDIFDRVVSSQRVIEITALGVAAASYIFQNNLPLSTMSKIVTKSSSWNPNMDTDLRDKYINKWNKAVEKSKQWT